MMSAQDIFMLIQKIVTFFAFVLACASGFSGPLRVMTSSSLTIEGVKQHPTMAMTFGDVKRGRQNYSSYAWAKEIGDDVTSAANVWLDRDAAWIRQHMPGKAACFAYGFAGCPECGGKTGIWANADCSFKDPGIVVCSGGHRLPNKKYPDSGAGYTGPDGRKHYFVGTYNAWAIEKFIYGAYDLAYAYSLTGDERYATRCAEILDSVADIYPTCTIGSWDYPETRPGQNSGRFNRPQYQVGRVLIPLSDTYDQIFHVAALDEPSVRRGISRRQNIEKNMLLDGAWYCYNQSFKFNGLTNGSADYIKGSLVVGLVLGIPEYVTWAVDGPYGIRSMLANNIGRDGTYYETATGYSYYTRFIYRGYAEYLRNHRSSNYPDGVDLYADQRFKAFMLLMNLKSQLGGEIASYGDAAPVTKGWKIKEKPFEKYDFECLEFLRIRSTDPKEKADYNLLSDWLTDGRPEEFYKDTTAAKWFLFNGEPLQRVTGQGIGDLTDSVLGSTVLGQKGLALLRTRGTGGEPDQGVLLRYGPALNHANFDDLNFTYHALGHDLTYDLGYALGSAHVYTGWSKQTASHQLVVVDELSQGNQGAPSGGELRAFLKGEYTNAVDASAPGPYRPAGVEEYGRTLFLVDDVQPSKAFVNGELEPSTPYLVDIFRVTGGSRHDSFTHSLGREVKFGGVNIEEATSTSLAGKNYEWGDKILVDGDVAGQANKPYWMAPPGNGYGFLMEPQELTPQDKNWWAEWKLPEDAGQVRIWFPEVKGEKALTAWGPGIQHNLPDAQYVVRRRQPVNGNSVFVTVWEPYRETSKIENVETTVFADGGTSWPAVAVKVTKKDGRIDWLYSAADESTRTIGEVKLAARLARFAYLPDDVNLLEAAGLHYNAVADNKGNDEAAAFKGFVSSVDVQNGIVTTDAVMEHDLAGKIHVLTGQLITFDNPNYSRSTAYLVKSVDNFTTGSVIRLTEGCVLGLGVVDEVDATSSTITSLVSHEYVKPVHRKGDSEFFKGKRVVNVDGSTEAHIAKAGVAHPLQLTLDSVGGFKPGDKFVYEDVQVGDSFEILSSGGRRWSSK